MRGGDPKKVGSLLEKYKTNIRAPQGSVVKVLQEVIKETFGTELKKHNISYNVRTKTISVTIVGPLKQEILLQKKAILSSMGKKLGTENTPHHLV